MADHETVRQLLVAVQELSSRLPAINEFSALPGSIGERRILTLRAAPRLLENAISEESSALWRQSLAECLLRICNELEPIQDSLDLALAAFQCRDLDFLGDLYIKRTG
jgi:hypothetical protein